MNNVLYLKSSILGEQSQSNALVDALRQHWTARYPQAAHVSRDLAEQPLPHLTSQHLAQAPEIAKVALDELKAADVLVVAAPMYNFGVPSTLKAWLDHVLKAGETFRYTAEGPQGLLTGKRAVVLASSGGVYSHGPYQAADFVVPYLTAALGFMGIVDVQVVRIEGVALGEAGVASRAAALEAVAKL